MAVGDNVFNNPTIFGQEMLRHLTNKSIALKTMHRGYEKEWDKEHNGYKPGQTVNLELPHYFRVKDGVGCDPVAIKSRYTTLTLDVRKHIAFELTTAQMTYNMKEGSDKFIKPVMNAFANYIDWAAMGMYTDIGNQVGVPGTTPTDYSTFRSARTRLTEESCPEDDCTLVVDPDATEAIVTSNRGLFHESMVKGSVQDGKLVSNYAGFAAYESNNVRTHTNGTAASIADIQKDGASASGHTTLAIKSTGTTETFEHGDVFTCAAVNSVNPISGQSTGKLRQFCVDTDVAMDGAGEVAALTCTPGTAPHALYDSTAAEEWLPYQNIDLLPGADAAITVAGTDAQQYKTNLAYHRDAFAVCLVPLVIPQSAVWSSRVSHEGISIRAYKFLDGTNDMETIRFDILGAMKTINPTLACRIAG